MKYLLLFLILTLSAFYTTLAQSNAGNALSLDGNDDYLQVIHIPELQFEGSFTISVWIRTTTMNNSSIIMQYECGNSCADAPSFYQVGILDQRAHFSLRDPEGVIVRAIDTINFSNDGNWHLFTGVRNLEDTTQLLYVDGVLVATEIAPDSTIGDDDGEEDPVVFGGRYAPGGSFVEGLFNGEIDEIRIWNVARTQEQIFATMLDTLGIEYYSTTDSGLVGYWRFDEFEDLGVNGGGIDDIRDFSVNNNHADSEGLPSLIPSGALVSVEKIDNLVPDNFYLSNNYPNPFNPSTTIEFSIPQTSHVTLEVFNALGKSVGLLVSKELTTGTYNYKWDASSLPSGVYFYRLDTEDFIQTKKMILMK
jgi:hypothetical protein